MLCKNPYVRGTSPYGCGQCLPCRLNRRRLWTHRLMLEAFGHREVSFVTLTYSDEFLPKNGSLDPGHVQRWLKRLRKAKFPSRVRFYLVGEYGDQSERPHYHVALFGHGGCLDYPLAEQKYDRRVCRCKNCDLIRHTWNNKKAGTGGITDCAHLSQDAAQYICGYVTKKLTKKGDPRLKGKHPEFARISNRPGIGALAMRDLVEFVLSDVGANDLILTGDVPATLRHGGKKLPLGRYLRRKLREYAGFKEQGGQKEVLQQTKSEMLEMLKAALGVEKLSKNPEVREIQIKAALKKIYGQKILSLEARHKIFSQKGNI